MYQNSYGQPPPQQGYGYGQPPPQQGYGQPPLQQGYAQPQQNFTPNERQTLNTSGEKFGEETKYRDFPFALLFLIDLIGIVVLLATGVVRDDNETTTNDDAVGLDRDVISKLILVTFASIGVSIVFSIGYLSLVRRYTKQFIIGTFIANIALWILFGVYLLAAGSLLSAIIMFVFAGIFAIFWYSWRSRIPFATAMLQTVSKVNSDYPGASYVAYLSLLVEIAWIVLFIYAVSVNQHHTGGTAYLIWLFFVFTFYWVFQVIKNVVHVTCSGTFATWYFLQGNMPSNPTKKSLKRSLTTSFGSICLGSLIVALLQTLRAMVRSARNQRNGILICIADCILGLIESLVRYFNLYAFTQVAIYGKTYCQAAKDTWALIQSSGVEAIINDNLISSVLAMGSLLGACIVGIASGLIGGLIISEYWLACAFIGFFIGFVMVSQVMVVIQSGVATIFVCFAEDKSALRRNDPELYETFVSTYSL